jgi:NAD(P)-dependent dehydrogenase (short-subunit alcohol dehydrogenase family)
MPFNLKGKTALITGGARGIGKAFAKSYLEYGAKVCIADIDFDQAQKVANALGENAYAVYLDVSRKESIDDAVRDSIRLLGSVNILINNAAIFTLAPISEITEEDFHRCFDVNVFGTLFTLQAVAKHMIEVGKGGKIINLSSQAGRRGEALVGVYCASKAAVISLTQSAGLDLIQYGINVNGISPGVVDSDMWDQVDSLFAKYENKPLGQKKQEVGKAVPYGRMGLPKDLTGMAVFLASDESDYIVAQTFNVDGGNWMS